ncbi:MAG: hypothetical protein HY981_01270 [Candidatus Magasanikbacteria bacterium]|nr:hypothetical protein [Candidatus Magasanikbacteria bacterium]
MREPSGALLERLRIVSDRTIPEPVIKIVLPLPPFGADFAPPASIKDSSYTWLKALHGACNRLQRFTLNNEKAVLLVEVRWCNTHKGDAQFTSTGVEFGHLTHTMVYTLVSGPATPTEDPAKWVVMWIDLQQGENRSVGKLMLTWKDFVGNASGALDKLNRLVAAHIKQYATQEHRTVMFSFMSMEQMQKI